MKKITTMLLCGIIAVSLAGCDSSGTSASGKAATESEEQKETKEEHTEAGAVEGETAEEQEETVEEMGVEEIADDGEQVESASSEKSASSEDTTLLRCFENLAQQVGLANYEDVIRYVDDTGIDYDAVEPSFDDMGTVTTVEDENGCHLYVAVFPDDQGEDTVCSISYGNGHFEGSVDDNTHVTEPVYKVYNIYADEPNTEVGDLDDIMAYIRDEMPALIAEDSAREPGKPIDVTLTVTAEVTDEGTVFTVDTNLPDGTLMMVSLDVNGNGRSAGATVEGGKASTVAMTENGSPLRGDFEVRVSMVNAVQQTAEVQAVIGVDGENLAGEYLGENTVGDPTISGTFNVSVD